MRKVITIAISEVMPRSRPLFTSPTKPASTMAISPPSRSTIIHGPSPLERIIAGERDQGIGARAAEVHARFLRRLLAHALLALETDHQPDPERDEQREIWAGRVHEIS